MKSSVKFNEATTKHRPKSWDDRIQLDDLTIEDCERLHESGFDVVIEDGRVVELKKSK
jgi:hypothetical protein